MTFLVPVVRDSEIKLAALVVRLDLLTVHNTLNISK